MNLMPSLVFQISYSETPKMFLGNFLADGTHLKTFLIVSELFFREIVVFTAHPALISRIFSALFEIEVTARTGNGNVNLLELEFEYAVF